MVLLIVAVVLIGRRLSGLDLAAVQDALSRFSLLNSSLVLLLVALDYLVLACYEVMAARYAGVNLPVQRVMYTSFICYTFNFNMGSLIGGVGFRYRLYNLWGVPLSKVTKILIVCVTTNWLGFAMVTAFTFFYGDLGPLERWLSDTGLTLLGVGCLSLVVSYLLLGRFYRGRLRIRQWQLEIPGWRFGAVQISLATLHWLLTSGMIYLLWWGDERVAFAQIVPTYLSAAIAGAVAHIPAGLGVIEAVFLTSFAGELEDAFIVAGILMFRCLYHLLPFFLALILYGYLEFRLRRERLAFREN